MGEILLICGVGPFVGGFVADLLFGTKGRWWRWYYAPWWSVSQALSCALLSQWQQWQQLIRGIFRGISH